MTARVCSNVTVLCAVLLAYGALAQDKPLELTPVGKAILQAGGDRPPLNVRLGSLEPLTFPLPMCTFPGGLCGAVRRDGTVAVPPRYDWIGSFSDHRAAVRLGGLYGFVDEDGHEIVKPQYSIVEDYQFGYAQVDVDGKSGLIDRDGKVVFAPKYGFIRAIAPDRFRVSEQRQLGGFRGAEDFSGRRLEFTASGGVSVSMPFMFGDPTSGVIGISGQWIERPGTQWSPPFDKDDPSIRWVQKDRLWGLARADGSWLAEPKFTQAGSLSDGLARVIIGGKVGFIDRTGNFAIQPVFDKASEFKPGFGRTPAERDGIVGVIDRSGAWAFRTSYQQIQLATDWERDSNRMLGWHFRKAERWGLLDLDGRVVLDADFDQSIQHCADGRLVAYKNKEWLYFNADGNPLQPPEGRLVGASCGNHPPYMLKVGDKFGLVDGHSNPLAPMHFDAVARLGQDAWNVKLDGKWGRIGPDGGWQLAPKFDYLSGYADIFVASIDGKRGFMRADGSWLIEPTFDAAARRRDKDTAFVTLAGATGALRLIDQSWIVPPRPGVMCDINDAIMWANDGKRAILSPSGESWIDIGAERISINLLVGLLTFLKGGKWGLVDTAGSVVAEPQFEEPVYFGPGDRGVAWAKRDGNWCAIDRRGHAVPGLPCADTSPRPLPTGWFECKVER